MLELNSLYIVHLLFAFAITARLGYNIFLTGGVFLKELFPHKEQFCKTVNRMLLLGYYLLNMGFISLAFVKWPQFNGIADCMDIMASNLGILLMLLGMLHFINLFSLFLLSYHPKFQNLIH